jgi:hypothetical protein
MAYICIGNVLRAAKEVEDWLCDLWRNRRLVQFATVEDSDKVNTRVVPDVEPLCNQIL